MDKITEVQNEALNAINAANDLAALNEIRIQYLGKPVIAYPNQGGIIIDGDHFELLGGAFVADVNDLDSLYQAYDYYRYM